MFEKKPLTGIKTQVAEIQSKLTTLGMFEAKIEDFELNKVEIKLGSIEKIPEIISYQGSGIFRCCLMESCDCIETQWPGDELLVKYQYISDFFIAVAYFFIPLELIYFVQKSAFFPY
ncbi:hypothetical protein RJ639_018711 [Escallonia herrerae]|uniref:Ethylene receptor 1-like N-terminal domain-containing protein n=1 Tax=Escallonia herrerae TaxID=1293975 RepID=A0AA88VCT4_9ASTE|nr:hypothetical protein RJ639_018711 [Escallonia herrerae]